MANENALINNPVFLIALFIIVIVIIIVIFKKSRNGEKYKFRELHKTIHEDLKEKFGLMGIKYKKFKPGLLFVNNHEIAKIKKFFTIKTPSEISVMISMNGSGRNYFLYQSRNISIVTPCLLALALC